MKSSYILALVLLLSACTASSIQPGGQAPPIHPPVTELPPTVVSNAASATPISSPAPPASPRPTAAPTAVTDLTPTVAGPLLRDFWPQAPATLPATTYLLYNEVISSTDAASPRRTAFWQVDLRDMRKRQLLPEVADRFPVLGTISPNQRWLAYRLDRTGEPIALHIVQLDGSDDRRVMEGLGSPSADLYEFAWSPDGTQLAFNKYEKTAQGVQNAFYLYDVRADTAPKRLVHMDRAQLIGWTDDRHLLGLIFADSVRLESITVDSGDSMALADVPIRKFVWSTILAPDRQKVFLSLDTGAYVFDLTAHTLTALSLSVAAKWPVWSIDSTALLGFPNQDPGEIQFAWLQAAAPTSLILISGATPTTNFNFLSAAPDGRYLVVCESRSSAASRTLLYDVPNDRWQTLAEGPDCVSVLGWLPAAPT